MIGLIGLVEVIYSEDVKLWFPEKSGKYASTELSSLWSNVDKSDDPLAAAIWQDAMATWPGCRQYKLRTVELMQLKPGDCTLDLGCGPGADLLSLLSPVTESGSVFGIDSSVAMISRAREKLGSSYPNIELLVANASELPFASGTFDACRADRVFQHLGEPESALHELVRVTKPGGRIVIVDPDQDTLVIAVNAGEITTKIRNFRKEHVANPSIAHEIGRLLSELGARATFLEGHTLIITNPSDAFGLVEWPDILHEEGRLSDEERIAWSIALKQSVEQGAFFYSVTFFITVAQKLF